MTIVSALKATEHSMIHCFHTIPVETSQHHISTMIVHDSVIIFHFKTCSCFINHVNHSVIFICFKINKGQSKVFSDVVVLVEVSITVFVFHILPNRNAAV